MLTLNETDKATIRETGRGFDGAAFSNFEAGVIARLQQLLDSGLVRQISRNHVKAACSQELAAGK